MEERMKTLAVLSQKGGTGKTTIAVHLAVEASRNGKTVALIDLDPQASAAKWSDTRSEDTPIVISAHATRLPQVLHTAEQGGVDLAIIDTSPNTDPTALNAAQVANLALIPSRDARFDLEAIGSTIQIGKMAGVEMRVVFNAVRSRSSMIYKAKRAVQVYGVPTAPCVLGDRVAFAHAVVDGKTAQEFEPRGKASGEVHALYRYVMKEMEV
jgi:chromosome partitioning protein